MELKDNGLEDKKKALSDNYDTIRYYVKIFGVPDEFKDDVVQDVCFIACKKLDSLHDINKIKSWLYTITLRRTIYFVKKRRVLTNRESMYSLEELETDILTNSMGERQGSINWDFDSDSIITDIIKTLKEPAQKIIILRFVEGFSLKEIAGKLQINYNTVKTIETRAFKKIKEVIEMRCSDNDEIKDE